MTKQAIPLGRILGIPIGLDYSWFLIFVLLTWTLAAGYYPAEFTNWPVAQYWIVGAATAILFFVSVVLHELGHSVVALRYKIPVRSITLFIFGGVAQIGSEPPSAVAEFWIAIAGPIVSFALAGLFSLLQPVSAGAAPLLALTKYLAYINGTLALFNLIPGFPLDGGRVFRALIWAVTHNLRRATQVAANVGRGIAWLMILAGVWQLLGGNLGGLWIIFLGWFLKSAAAGQVQQQEIHDLLNGHHVSEAASRNTTAVPANATLQQLVNYYLPGSGQRSFVVERDGEVVGLVTLPRIREVPRTDWPMTTVAQAMIPIAQLKWVRPETDLSAALDEMERDGINQLPVIADHHVVGLLTLDSIVGFLRTMREFGSQPG